MPSFIEGFAKGFISERNRRLEREEKVADMQRIENRQDLMWSRDRAAQREDQQNARKQQLEDQQSSRDFAREQADLARQDALNDYERNKADEDARYNRSRKDSLSDFERERSASREDQKLSWEHQKGIVQEQRQHEKEQTMLQYGLNNLVKQRDKRTEKAAQEAEWGKQARALAGQMQDPNSAGSFYKELAGGVSFETIQERIGKGFYQKNEKWQAPSATYRIPDAVSMKAVDELPTTDPGTLAEIMRTDPTLLVQENKEDTFLSDTADSYIFKPTDKIEVGNLNQALFDVARAKKEGIPEKVAEAQMRLDAIKLGEATKAEWEANKEGNTTNKAFVLKDDKGFISSGTVYKGRVETDADGRTRIINASTNQVVTVDDPSRLVEVDKDSLKTWSEQANRASDRVQKYNLRGASLASTIDTTQKMKAIAARNFHATSAAGNFLSMAVGLEQDVQGFFSILDQQSAAADAAYNSGDMEAFAKHRHEFNTTVQNIEKKFGGGGGSIFSQANLDLAADAAMYKALKKKATYDLAAANGITGNDTSNKDIAAFETQLDGTSFQSLSANIDNANRGVITKLVSEEIALTKDNGAKFLAEQLGVKGITNLTPERIGDLIPNEANRRYYDQLRREVETGADLAVIGTTQPQAAQSSVKPGVGGKKYEYVGPQPMTEEDRRNKSNWKEVN